MGPLHGIQQHWVEPDVTEGRAFRSLSAVGVICKHHSAQFGHHIRDPSLRNTSYTTLRACDFSWMAETKGAILPTEALIGSPLTGASRHLTLKPSRVFEIPELSRLISGFLSRKDACSFLRCSRVCFHTTVAQVWESVPTVVCLFTLLPGVGLATGKNMETAIVRGVQMVEIGG